MSAEPDAEEPAAACSLALAMSERTVPTCVGMKVLPSVLANGSAGWLAVPTMDGSVTFAPVLRLTTAPSGSCAYFGLMTVAESGMEAATFEGSGTVGFVE